MPFGVKRCVGPNGIQESPITPLDGTLPTCDASGSTISPECGSQADGGCPSLAGDCVDARSWLGQSPPASADTSRPNVFATEQACNDGLARATAHPGVEDPLRSLGTCRRLCGTPLVKPLGRGGPSAQEHRFFVRWFSEVLRGFRGHPARSLYLGVRAARPPGGGAATSEKGLLLLTRRRGPRPLLPSL